MANICSDCSLLFNDHYFEYYSSETHSNEVEAISFINEKLTLPASQEAQQYPRAE